MLETISASAIFKVNDELGVVMGYALICCEKNAAGEWVDHYDTQGHHTPEREMLVASFDFAQRVAVDKAASKDMHDGEDVQEVVQMLAVTRELADSLEWQITKTGLVIMLKPTPDIFKLYKADPATAPDFRTGFSIGGFAELVEVEA